MRPFDISLLFAGIVIGAWVFVELENAGVITAATGG